MVKGAIWMLAALGILALGAMAYVRLAPLPPARLAARPGPMEPGVHVQATAIKQVLPLADLPQEAFARLQAIILATLRTRQVESGPNWAAFVTRSAVWGFPDIAVIWVQDGALHIHSALVYGAADLGVNAARVQGWTGQL